MKIIKANRPGIAMAVKYLRAGKAVVYPTDTAYGLGVDATNVRAVRRLYKMKGRGYSKPTHVIVKNCAIAQNLTMANSLALKLMRKFWPGPLTIILELRIRNQESWKILSAGTGTIGVRVPNNRIALALVKGLKRPITTPSANPAGGPPPYSIRDSLKQFKGKKYQPDLYLDAGKLPKRAPSTIIKIDGKKIKTIRRGPVTQKQIALLFTKN